MQIVKRYEGGDEPSVFLEFNESERQLLQQLHELFGRAEEAMVENNAQMPKDVKQAWESLMSILSRTKVILPCERNGREDSDK